MNPWLMRGLFLLLAGACSGAFWAIALVMAAQLPHIGAGLPSTLADWWAALWGLAGLAALVGSIGACFGLVAAALCAVPSLLLIHRLGEQKPSRGVALLSGACIGVLPGLALTLTQRQADPVAQWAMPFVAILGGIVAAEIFFRLSRRYL